MPFSVEEARELPQLTRPDELLFDIENLAEGLYAPVRGFVGRNDYLSIIKKGRLESGEPWTIPIVLDLDRAQGKSVKVDGNVAISNVAGYPHSIVKIEEVYEFDKREFCEQTFGTNDPAHPGVQRAQRMGEFLVSGPVEVLAKEASQFDEYLLSPKETRQLFRERGWKTVVGFQTRNVPHLGHEYLQKSALTFVDGLFVNPLIGPKKPGDFKDEVILAAYEALLQNYYPKGNTALGIFRTQMRYAGPKEAIFHAIVRRNFGCTHFIVGRDHAGVGKFYAPYAAQEIFKEYPDLGITPLFAREFFHCYRCGTIANDRTCPHPAADHFDFSGTKLRKLLASEKEPPKELIRPEVFAAIRNFPQPFVE